jgi:hypothetical protein
MSRLIAVAHLPHLALTLAPAPRDVRDDVRVVVVDDRPVDERTTPFVPRAVHRIQDAAPALWAQGVLPGMRLNEAQARVPALLPVVVDEETVQSALVSLAELLLAHAPTVEPTLAAVARLKATRLAGDWKATWAPSIALDLTGLVLPPRVVVRAIAATLRDAGHDDVFVACSPQRRLSWALAVDCARHKSRYKNKTVLVVDNDVDAARARERLSVDCLGIDDETVALLRDLGVKTAGDVRALLPGGAAARLKDDARGVLRLLDKDVDEPLTPLVVAEQIIEGKDLDDGIAHLEPLRFVSAPLCERVVARARVRGHGIAAVDVHLFVRREGARKKELVPSTVHLEFPEPLVEGRAILGALFVRLEQIGVPGAVERVQVHVERVSDHARKQQDAFRPDLAPPRALQALIAELQTGLGKEHVGFLRLVPSPLPETMDRLSPAVPKAGAAVFVHGDSDDADVVDGVVDDGHFLCAWPWPLRMLKTPLVLEDFDLDLDVIDRWPFARVEGEDESGLPFLRDYQVLLLKDGRSVLAFVDPAVVEVVLAGWFD